MGRTRVTPVLGLLALVAIFAMTATHSTPSGGHGIGIWPVGGATACLMISRWPRTPVLLGAVALIGVATLWLGGRDLAVAIGLGVGLAAEAGVTWWIVAGGRRERPPLRTTLDLARLLAGIACGAAVVAAAALLASATTGFGDPAVLALSVATSGLLAQLTVVPFFCRMRNHAPLARPAERIAQWFLVLTLAPLVFVPEDFPSIVFVLIPVILRAIVTAAAAVVAPTLERRELELDVDLPDEPIPFLGDRDMLERVVIDLVGNAVKLTPEGGRVHVALDTEPDVAVLAVADTGIGIPREEQERLFTRFFRSSLAQKQAIPGSGLGLSIAHAIVDQHGGSMSVESEPGMGTTFRVRLPLLTAA